MNKLVARALFVLICTTSACGGGASLKQSPPTPPSSPQQTADQRADRTLSQMTLQEKLQMVHGNLTLENGLGPRNAVGWIAAIPRLAIPELLYGDASTVSPATALPSALASAATWDLTEAHKYGQVIGNEMNAFAMNVYLGGNVNLTAREPRDGRTFETKGEDLLWELLRFERSGRSGRL